jgi:hypothetical protein
MKRSRATSKPGWAASKPHRRGDKSPCADPKTAVHRARPIVQRDAIPRPPDQAFHAPPKTPCAVRKSVCAPRKTVCAAPAFTLCSVKTRPCITQILLGTTQIPLCSSHNPPRSRFSPIRGRIWEQNCTGNFPPSLRITPQSHRHEKFFLPTAAGLNQIAALNPQTETGHSKGRSRAGG